jgi:hypothetical protein
MAESEKQPARGGFGMWLPAWRGRVTGRRELSFADLGAVMPDVERLLAGHVTVGRWSLAQICSHLAGAVSLTLDGFPAKAPWLLRKTLGVVARWRIFRTGRMPEGVRVPRVYLPRAGLDAASEAAGLARAIERFRSSAGPFAEHPFLGPLSPARWECFHCIHCAHHLSFVVPDA